MKMENVLRQKLKSDTPSIGTRIQNSWPSIIELVGYSKSFDYVEFLAEYAPFDLYSLENMGRAIDMFPHMSGMIKIEQGLREHLALHSMNAGFQNFLFTDIRTAEEARQVVRTVRPESPVGNGLHGVGHGRDAGIVLEIGSQFWHDMAMESVVALMIEKKEAIENLESILSVEGVDMVQFGPGDYSMSIGKVGKRGVAEVQDAEKYMIETALRMGVTPRAEIHLPEDAARYMNMGVKHFCMGTDTLLLYWWYRDNGKRLRDILAS
jgi:2-keto-3-deoxy-L-rhamnonate aldolase RhmA